MIKSEKEWNDLHRCCPTCGSKCIIQTLMAQVQIKGQPYGDDFNYATCMECGWDGKVNELVKETI